MALSEARRASLLAYCRIEEPTAEELLTLEGLYDAAVGYLEQAGVSEPEEGTPRRAQYDLCVNFMVLRDFDLREATITGTIVNDNPAFRRPSFTLECQKAEQSDVNIGLVRRSVTLLVTCYVEADAYHDSSRKALNQRQDTVMGLFAQGFFQVEDRALTVQANRGLGNPDFAEVSAVFQWMDARPGCQDPEAADTPKMEHFAIKRTAL